MIKTAEFDEVLFTLARAIGDLAEYFLLDSLKILEELFVNEETVIRSEALEAFNKVLGFLSKEELTTIVIPSIIALKSDSQFTGKIA